MDKEMDGKNVKLMSSDGKIFEVPDTILKKRNSIGNKRFY